MEPTAPGGFYRSLDMKALNAKLASMDEIGVWVDSIEKVERSEDGNWTTVTPHTFFIKSISYVEPGANRVFHTIPYFALRHNIIS